MIKLKNIIERFAIRYPDKEDMKKIAKKLKKARASTDSNS